MAMPRAAVPWDDPYGNVVPFPDDDHDLAAPPHSLHAEEAVLGSVLKNPASLRQVADWLKPQDFYGPRNRHVYQAMLDLHAAGKAVDYHLLGLQLEANGTDKAAGGLLYLAEINVSTPSAAYIEHYARVVADHGLRRAIISINQDAASKAWRAKAEPDELLADYAEQLHQLRQRTAMAGDYTVGALVERAMARYAAAEERAKLWQVDGGVRLAGLPTGHTAVDRLCLGLRAGSYTLLGARTGKGKSQLQIQWAVNIAKAAAAKRGTPVEGDPGVVVYFSLEMSEAQFVDRILAMLAHVPRRRMDAGVLSADDRERLRAAGEVFGQLPLALRLAERTTQAMQAVLYRLASKHGYIRAVFVDYVQLVEDTDGRQRATRNDELGLVSRGLVHIAHDFDCPVVASAQLSRSLDSRRSPIPRLSDFRDSGNLEQDADMVLALVRNNTFTDDEEQDNETQDPPGQARIYKLKDRNMSETRSGGNMCRLVWVEGGEFYADIGYEQGGAPRRNQGGYQQAGDLPFR